MGGGGEVQLSSRRAWWSNPVPLAALNAAICAAILVASYLKTDWARNDFERFDDLRLTFSFFALFTGLCATYAAIYSERLWASRRLVLLGAAACAGALLASFPVGSKDVFAYSFFGKIWVQYGANPFTVAAAEFSDDPWQRYVVGLLRRPVSVYGPAFLWQSWPIAHVAGDELWLAALLHKGCATMWLAGTLWVADRSLRADPSLAPAERARAWLLLAWNPLFLFESAGSAHNDVAMVLLLLAAFWATRRAQWVTALSLLALSFWYKWYSLLFAPAFAIHLWKSAGARTTVRLLLWSALIAVVMGLVLFAPFPGATATLVGQLLGAEKLQGIFPTELSPPLALLFWVLHAGGWFESEVGFRAFDLIRFALFAAVASLVFARQWRISPTPGSLPETCFLIGLCFCGLLITQLWPWHLLTVIACALVSGREPHLRVAVVLTLLALLSYFLTFAVATAMLTMIVASLWLMRKLRPARA
jgi:hypothetical protein